MLHQSPGENSRREARTLRAEADRLCGAGRYERSEEDTRAGSYERTLHTKAGDVRLKIPKLRRQTFETATIERYRRRGRFDRILLADFA